MTESTSKWNMNVNATIAAAMMPTPISTCPTRDPLAAFSIDNSDGLSLSHIDSFACAGRNEVFHI